MESKACEVCGKEFEVKYGNSKYCSKKCQYKAARDKKREKGFKLICQKCGKEFIGKCAEVKYCSSECRRKELNKHKCLNCGVEFEAPQLKRDFCGKECLKEYQQTSEEYKERLRLISGASTNQFGDNEQREKRFRKQFEKKFPEFKYHSGYVGSDSDFNMECKVCGHIQTRTAQKVRPSRNKGLTCDYCTELTRARAALVLVLQKIINQTTRENNKQINEQIKKQQRQEECKSICAECGKEFIGDRRGRKYCSVECSKKRNNKQGELRRRMRYKNNGGINWDITVNSLSRRDKNKCHICGGKCDNKDFTINEQGHFIVGKNYPSIDHLIPISKGGTHSWDNVKLAHHYCNTIKSNNEVYEDSEGQIILAV